MKLMKIGPLLFRSRVSSPSLSNAEHEQSTELFFSSPIQLIMFPMLLILILPLTVDRMWDLRKDLERSNMSMWGTCEDLKPENVLVCSPASALHDSGLDVVVRLAPIPQAKVREIAFRNRDVQIHF